MRKGFTLIELLVVVAIIAILAAMLFPVFLKVRENAAANKCLAHGRQLGQAMLMYLDDNNNRFPTIIPELLEKFKDWRWEYDWPAKPGVETWGVSGMNSFAYIQLAPYVKNKEIWICPFPSGPYGTKYAYGYRNSWFFISGGLVKWASDYPDACFTDSNGIGRIITEVLSEDRTKYGRPGVPSKKVFACCYALGPDIPIEAYAGGPLVTPYFPHGEGTIYVYLDGHARWQETGCGWAPVWYTNHRMDRPHKHGISIRGAGR